MKSRRAFTVAEVVLVLLVLAVLAAVTVGTVRNTRGKASVPSMQSDLERLKAAEASYFATNHRYTLDLAALSFRPTNGVSVSLTSANDTTGYTAVATLTASPASRCTLAVGPEAGSSPAGTATCAAAPAATPPSSAAVKPK